MALSSLINTIPNQGSWSWGTTGHPTSPAIFGTLTGAQPSGYNPAFGGVPQVPNPAATQSGALQGNLANLGNIEQLTNAINQMELQFGQQQNQLAQQQAAYNTQLAQQQAQWFNNLNQNIAGVNNAQALDFSRQADLLAQQMVNQQYAQHIPGLSGLEAQRAQNIQQQQAGMVPRDVIGQLWQAGAEKGIGFGPDSPAANAAYLQALGTNSLAQVAAGGQNLTSALGSVPQAPLTQPQFSAAPFATTPNIQAPYANVAPFNPASMLLNPEQQQEWQYLANMLNAAPIPGAAQNANMQALMQMLNRGYNATAPSNLQTPYSAPTAPTMTPGTPAGATQAPYQQGPSPGYMTPQTASDEAFWQWMMGGQSPEEYFAPQQANIPTYGPTFPTSEEEYYGYY